jgi:hypothetical protein
MIPKLNSSIINTVNEANPVDGSRLLEKPTKRRKGANLIIPENGWRLTPALTLIR